MTTCMNHTKIHDIVNLIHKLHSFMRCLENGSSSKPFVKFIMKPYFLDLILLNFSNRLMNNLKQTLVIVKFLHSSINWPKKLEINQIMTPVFYFIF